MEPTNRTTWIIGHDLKLIEMDFIVIFAWTCHKVVINMSRKETQGAEFSADTGDMH